VGEVGVIDFNGYVLGKGRTITLMYSLAFDQGGVYENFADVDAEGLESGEPVDGGSKEDVEIPVTLAARKSISGTSLTNTKFLFALAELNSADPADSKAGGLSETRYTSGVIYSGKPQTVSFGAIYGLAQGEHFYRITEVAGNETGWAYAKTVSVATVSVDADGLASISYDGKPDSPLFANSYSAPTGDGGDDPPPPKKEDPDDEKDDDDDGDDGGDGGETPGGGGNGGGGGDTPPVRPGSSYVPGDGGSFIEIGEDGTPLGEWRYDPIEESWIFEPYTPLADLPQTGDPAFGMGLGVFFLLAAALCCAGAASLAAWCALRRRHAWPL
jgi:hypothetical protein